MSDHFFSKNRGAILSILLVVLIDLIGFGIVIPILPYYSMQFGASGLELGFLMMSYSLMQLLVSPFWGSLSDRLGRRPILLFTIFGTCASYVFLGLSHSLLLIFLGRFIAGFFGANISTAYAAMTDLTDEKHRTKAMGLIGAAFGIGFIIGPALGGILSRVSYSAPLFFAAGLSLVNLVLAYFTLKEPPLSAEEREKRREKKWDWSVIKKVLARKESRFPIFCFLLVTIAHTQMEVLFAISLKDRFSLSAEQAGYLLALTGLAMAFVQGGLVGKLSRLFQETKLLFWGCMITWIGLLFFGVTQNLGVVIVSLLILALGQGLMNPTLSSITSKSAPSDERGSTMGVYQSAGSLGRVLGPPVAGALYDSVSPESSFYFGVGCLLAVLWISLKNKKAEAH